MRKIGILLAAALTLASCTNNEQFRVNGTIEGKPTMNIRVAYYADGAVRTIVTAAREGEFEFFGSSRQPTLVEISDYEYRPLARLYAANGETFELHVDRARPFATTISGNEVSARWSKFLNDNAETMAMAPDSANAAIERYVRANTDDVVSALLLLTAYDSSAHPLAADSLLARISASARPSGLLDGYNYLLQRLVAENTVAPVEAFRYLDGDSATTFDPAANKASLLAFTDDTDDAYEALAERLEKTARHSKNKAVIDLRMPGRGYPTAAPDTLHRKLGQLPGGIMSKGIERLGIPSVPFFIVTDSLGTQLYRGKAVERAIAVADSLANT